MKNLRSFRYAEFVHIPKAMWRLNFIVLILLSACSATARPDPATIYATPTPVHSVLRSSDGKIWAETDCFQAGTHIACVTKFPNGEIIRGASGDWSPDGYYAINCMGGTQICNVFELWDMVNGRKQAVFQTWYCYAWSPIDAHLLGYLSEGSIGENQWQFHLLDASTGRSTRQKSYPDWFRTKWDSTVDGSACRRPLDVIMGSDHRAFIETPTQIPSENP